MGPLPCRRLPPWVGRAMAIAALLAAWPGSAAAQSVVETFAQQIVVADGTALGQCQQLTVRQAAGGSVTVGGGQATIASPTIPAGALIASSDPLPATPHVLRVRHQSLAIEKGADVSILAAVVAQVPQVGDSNYWLGSGVVAVAAYGGFGVAISYWSPTNEIHSWDGSSWVQGAFVAAFAHQPNVAYDTRIERTATGYKLEVRRAGTLIADPSLVTMAQLKPFSDGYLLVGEPRSDVGAGSVVVDRITMPAPPSCGASPDAGPPPADASAPPPDGAAADGASPTDSAVPPGDGSAPPGDGSVSSWDLQFHGLVPDAPDEGCGCAVPGRSPPTALWSLLLAWSWCRRRRRAQKR